MGLFRRTGGIPIVDGEVEHLKDVSLIQKEISFLPVADGECPGSKF